MKILLNILKALSDETRLRIINILYEGELCVCDIMATLQISQTKASRHLSYLKNAGLVTDRKHAQWVYYSIIKNEGNKFIDNIIFNNLRNFQQFNEDIKNLKEELAKRKDILCD